MREGAIRVGLAIGGGAAALGVIAVALLSQSGCFWHVCDPSTVVLGGPGGEPLPAGASSMTLPTGQVQWQSSPAGGPWLDFSGQRTFAITLPQPLAATPMPAFSCLLSADVNQPQMNETECGTLPQWIFDVPDSGADSGPAPITRVSIFNPTCAEYGLNVLVTGFPATPSGSSDPASIADAGAGDAAAE